MPVQLDEIQKALIEFFSKLDDGYGLTLRDIAASIGVNHAQTVLNKLNQLIKLGYFVKDPQGYRLIKNFDDGIFFIPVYWFAQCGNRWTAILQEYTQEKIPVTLQLIWTSSVENCFFMRAKGNSMEPKIYDWDLVLIRQQESYDESDFVFSVHNWLPKLKKIVQKADKKYLVSLNRDFEDLEISEYDETLIIWVVKKIIKDI